MSAARLPVINGCRVIKALERAGFVVDRVVGSHHVLTLPGDPTRTVAVPASLNACPPSVTKDDLFPDVLVVDCAGRLDGAVRLIAGSYIVAADHQLGPAANDKVGMCGSRR